MNTVQNKIKKLMQEREQLCFRMIEADGDELAEMEQELQSLEHEIELGAGRTIDELETQMYKGDN